MTAKEIEMQSEETKITFEREIQTMTMDDLCDLRNELAKKVYSIAHLVGETDDGSAEKLDIIDALIRNKVAERKAPRLALNEMAVTLTLKRIQVCDLMLALTIIGNAREQNGYRGNKWRKLHDEVRSQLDEFDEKQGF